MRSAARTYGALAVVIVAALHGVAADPLQTPAAPNTDRKAAIVGRVVNSLNGAPVPEISVSAGLADTVTDAQGRFVLRNLPRGLFHLRASGGSLAATVSGSGAFGQTSWSSQPLPLQVEDGQVLRDIVVPFWPDAVISGRVTDSMGEPLAGVVVTRLQRTAAGAWRWSSTQGADAAHTDDRGRYRLVVDPGQSRLGVTTTELRTQSLADGSGRVMTFRFPDTFFPEVKYASGAEAIALKPGEERTVDFRIAPVRASAVSGTLVGMSDKEASARLQAITVPGGGPLPETMQADADPSGRFSFPAVPAGTYSLSAATTAACRNGEGAEAPPARLIVDADDVAGVRLELYPCPELSGQLIFSGTRNPTEEELHSVFVRTTSTTPSDPLGSHETAIQLGPVRNDGRFSMHPRAGRGFVVANSLLGWTMESVTVDGRDVTDRLVDFAPTTSHQVVIRMSETPASLDVAVTSKMSSEVSDAVVYLFPASEGERRQSSSPRRARLRAVNAGEGLFEDVPPGTYAVIALADFDDRDWPSLAAMSMMQTRSTRVIVGPGQRQQMSVVVVRADDLPRVSGIAVDEDALALGQLCLDERVAAADRNQRPVISGRVVAAGTEAPIPGAVVTIDSRDLRAPVAAGGNYGAGQPRFMMSFAPPREMTAVADEAGRFSFFAVPPGEYTLAADRVRYSSGMLGAGRFGEDGATVTVRAGQPLTGVNVILYPGAAIAGTVTNASGAPLAHVSLELAEVRQTIKGRELVGSGERMETDSLGRYRIGGISPGEYILTASAVFDADLMTPPNERDFADPLSARTDEQPPRYGRRTSTYPSGADLDGAPAAGFLLTEGEERTIDLRMPAALTTTSSPSRELPPLQGPAVTGHVVLAAGTDPVADRSTLTVAIKPWRSLESPYLWRASLIDPQGRFVIKDLCCGPYQHEPQYQWDVVDLGKGPRRWIITSVVANGRERLDVGLDLINDGPADDVVVTISDRPAVIDGVVGTPGLNGARERDGVYVVLFPADSAGWVPQSPRLRAARPNLEGRFEFTAIVPGDYLVAMLNDVPPGAWLAPGALAQMAPQAMRVTVGAGQRATLRLR